ncbi:aminoglycoside adenylyltransferase domain-containing protein [Micromonospora sp. NPDC047620]|uniref:aminoglycoside adenylyltransferase domain-containing protein n=1 Tax=Micromonospora sp. NPDC047620 TaxID=3364251 RepID=UPI0037132D61
MTAAELLADSMADIVGGAAFMVLTACRIWRFAVENVHCSNAQAAEWALDRDPSLTAIRQAVHQYEQDPASMVDEQGIADLLDSVLHEPARTRQPMRDQRGEPFRVDLLSRHPDGVPGAFPGSTVLGERGGRSGSSARRSPAT